MVIDASGAIGAAFRARLQANPKYAAVVGLHRQSLLLIDFEREETIAAATLSSHIPFDLIINAAELPLLHRFMPKKRFFRSQLCADARDLSGILIAGNGYVREEVGVYQSLLPENQA